MQRAKQYGLKCPIMAFGPDATFSTDVRNDKAATVFLSKHVLEDGKFMCCIPRYRKYPMPVGLDVTTPYDPNAPIKADFKKLNDKMKDKDHAILRETIIRVIRETDMKVLVCPEDISQVSLGKEMIVDKLPKDVRKRVVWKDQYWLTDEALSTYVRSAGLFGLEMHSPIMCIGNNIPAIVGRFAEQGIKGNMWNDIGLNYWLFNFDKKEDVKKYLPAVLEIAKNPEKAKIKAKKAHVRAGKFQLAMIEALKKSLS